MPNPSSPVGMSAAELVFARKIKSFFGKSLAAQKRVRTNNNGHIFLINCVKCFFGVYKNEK